MRNSIGLLIGLALPALLLAGSAAASDCRPPHERLDTRLQTRAGCESPVRDGDRNGAKRGDMRAQRGFIDLGNGTQVRIGGRARMDMELRR